jgi:nucleoside-diphosphate-sugar epimerase/ferritin-like metal-binding protein YciE
MRVIVTGATGNVGTSVIEALSDAPEVDEAVGLARRRPAWNPPKTRWIDADILASDLAGCFQGADAVIHLAWAIQPSHDEETLERINVEGSRRVFDAVAAAGVPKLVYASSVGAYSPGPGDEKVEESWPIGATQSSFYSRHKATVERMLDVFEAENPAVKVVRLRPALIFKGDAATEIRRLFAGPFLPGFLVRSSLVPALPRIPGLRFQAVHSADVGQAYLLATVGEATGAFNIAADPPLGTDELAEIFDARTFRLPVPVARRLTDLSWRLHLQPTPPGWLDMALNVPLMSTARAREELGWEPRIGAVEALEELLDGIRHGRGYPTPPLEEAGAAGRVEEIRTGVGSRQWRRDRGEQLIKYLADAHAIEQQAVQLLESGPGLVDDEALARLFREHLEETRVQVWRLEERLHAHGASPSLVKDAALRAGALNLGGFFGVQPDTTTKLAGFAYAFEHLEIAAYELLKRVAERAGDEKTAETAELTLAEERVAAGRIAATWDRPGVLAA